jgi:hypothetical protein
MTDRTVTALYPDFASAQAVADDLVSMGFQPDTISIVANDASGQYASTFATQAAAMQEDVSAGEGASFGAVIGGLVGLGAMAIPGIGPVIAAGPLVALLIGAGVGAATGAVTGGLIAGLVDMGIPEDEAGYYAEGVRRGGVLLLVNTTGDWVERVVEVMEAYNPINVERMITEWRSGGWAGFDANATPIAESQLAAERDAYRRLDDEAQGTRVYTDATG